MLHSNSSMYALFYYGILCYAGEPGRLKQVLTKRMCRVYNNLRVIDGVDATDAELVAKHCQGELPTLVVFGSPHINTLGNKRPVDQLAQGQDMTNPAWKLHSFYRLLDRFPTSAIFCPMSGHHELFDDAVCPMLPSESHDRCVTYEPLASHSLYLQRLCAGHEVDLLTNVDASGPIDLREEIVSRTIHVMSAMPYLNTYAGIVLRNAIPVPVLCYGSRMLCQVMLCHVMLCYAKLVSGG